MPVLNLKGIKFPVTTVSVAEYKAIGDQFAEQSLLKIACAGGFMAACITAEQISAMRAMNLGQKWDAEIDAAQTGPSIFVLSDFLKTFEDDEIKALLLHEEAHLIHGDIDRGLKQVNGFILDDEAEMAADAYAAQRTSKGAVYRGLRIAICNISRILAKANASDVKDEEAKLLATPSIRARLAALQ